MTNNGVMGPNPVVTEGRIYIKSVAADYNGPVRVIEQLPRWLPSCTSIAACHDSVKTENPVRTFLWFLKLNCEYFQKIPPQRQRRNKKGRWQTVIAYVA